MSSPVLDDIRGRFLETSRLRLGEMDLLLRRLEEDPGDAAALQQLARHFHGLAGLGGTCGFPRVSELGDEAEAMMLPMVRRGAAPDAAMVVHFRELAATIGREIAGNDGVPSFLADAPGAGALAGPGTASRDREEHPPRRILVVDDDEVANELFRGILSSSGYEVEVCRNPVEFEKVLFAFRPDLLLMDVQLSHELTGHDLVRLVRQSEQFSRLPVIIVTSESERRAVEDADAGADTLVTKPVNWDTLLSHIAARLERAAVVRDPAD
jgi:CheY-like chemotaxis protein